MQISVSYAEPTEVNSLLYGQKHPNTLQYFERQLENVSQTLTDAGKSFMSNAHDLWNRYNGSEAMHLARAALRKAGSIFQQDSVRPLWELSDIQNAPLTMQRWIMAEPTVRKMFNEQRCDGYSSTYVDMHPGSIEGDHYDYRRVMNGLVTIDDDGLAKTTFYMDELLEGDRELFLDEKVAIRNTWEIVADLMKYGTRDVTSVWDNKL